MSDSNGHSGNGVAKPARKKRPCAAIRKNGNPCRGYAGEGGFCGSHRPGDQFTPVQRAYLEARARTVVLSEATAAAGIDRTTPARHWRDNPEFVKAEEAAKAQAVDRLVAEAERRSTEGLRSYKFHQGAPIMVRCSEGHPEAVEFINQNTGEPFYLRHYYEVSVSDNLLMFLVKKERPEYRERQELNVNATFTLADAVRAIQERRGAFPTRN